MLVGPDVSNHQGTIQWNQIKLGGSGNELAFAIAKASEGRGYRDPYFDHNWHGIGERGLIRGAYHFAHPGVYTPQEEATNFLTMLHGVGGVHPGDLPPALDLEGTPVIGSAAIYEWVRQWVHIIRTETGRIPMIYTGYFWKDYLNAYTDSWGCPLWLAQYCHPPILPHAWKAYTLWQTTSSARLVGYSGNLDLSVFNGGRAELHAFVHGKAGAPVGPHGWGGRTLRRGVHGDDVRRWQHRMHERGFTELHVDGVYDERSMRSCRWLQLYLRYPPTGEVDEAVWRATFATT
jgi:lysozyme